MIKMSNSIIFKTFRTYAHPYVYDRHTNAVVMLTDDEYEELVAIEKGELAADNSAVIKRYQEQGLFQPNVVEEIEHSSTDKIEPYLGSRVQQLTLQVTQQCNLRCAYCAYSGIYEKNRVHSSARMSFETAKKAIDHFISHNHEISKVVIGFYGGEPLLEYELIKRCVEYVKLNIEGKRLRFNMTTNGTLLTDEVVDFLVENEFYLSISLDGSQKEHDVNRKFKNGKGSFETIINNIKRIRDRYPEYEKNMSIMTTVNPHMDLGCVVDYFNTEELMKDKHIVFNTMNEKDLKESAVYEDEFYNIRNFEYIKLLFSMIGKIDQKYVSPLVIRSGSSVEQYFKSIRNHSPLTRKMHHGGPCVPGVRKLFVRTDGYLYPCERVNELQSYYCIGHVDKGINIEQAKSILNIGKLSSRWCKQCWALRHCSICAAQLDFECEPDEKSKLNRCFVSKQQAWFSIKELCVLNEFGLTIEK